jgi:hypothetical protein
MSLNKWHLVVCTMYTTEEAELFDRIKTLLDEDSATPYYKSRLTELTREQAKNDFGVPEEQLRIHYNVCSRCEEELQDGSEIWPDQAMEEQFNKWGFSASEFAYCSEQCRMLHLLETYQKKGRF